MWGQLPAPGMSKAIVLKVLDEGSEGLGEAQVSLVSSLSFRQSEPTGDFAQEGKVAADPPPNICPNQQMRSPLLQPQHPVCT